MGHGFGRLTGAAQIEKPGNIETPIVLTNILRVPTAVNALIDDMTAFADNREALSVNLVAGETNDGYLNDGRGRHVGKREAPSSALQGGTGCMVRVGHQASLDWLDPLAPASPAEQRRLAARRPAIAGGRCRRPSWPGLHCQVEFIARTRHS